MSVLTDKSKNSIFLKRSMETINILLAVFVSAITGAIASLIAPWANWGVDKRRRRLEWRKGFINECKRIINKRGFEITQFRDTSYYSNIKINLSKLLTKEIANYIGRYGHGKRLGLEEELKIVKKEASIKSRLLEEITLLEKKWGLL